MEIPSNPKVAALETRIYSPEPAIQHPAVLIKDLIRDINAGRELAWRLFTRDLKAMYRQTYLGYVWAFLPPLVASATFIFLQSQGITRIEGTGIAYAAFAMMGTLLWQTFVEAMQSPLLAVQNAKPMLAKINFPREAILMAGLYMVVFNFLIRLVLLVVVMAIWQVVPGATVVLFPLMMLGLLLAGFCIGLALVPVGGLYGDVGKAIPIVAGFWMLLTPVVYPARTEGLAGVLAVWNPVSPLITTARATLTGQPLEHLAAAIVVILIAFLISLAGLLAFRLIMPHLIERMGG
ncbi:ABC transporter permease [Allorhodopirellula heiligendammensis]|uniref:ABC-2 type transporter n=1 Tax=Allorhodopirellula heiligendammensis TaxID=2714739 RepID=A0A5C6C1R4_9BACT|nr:ABC transporter permease [Allorhodopirellula heiligendammensis]TWU18065.1 ABC-2 type transporter [Allorhodopirellula heiligendammensis]|tara:strand:+ start:520 stop:1395 length:876 start_codon:yes stop_codon:yes gene_type:complete